MSKFGPKPKNLLEIFLSGVQKTDGCWIWTKSRSNNGYGQIGHRENGHLVHKLAHRVSYELFIGPIPDGIYVCHTCDNPPCINPKHLWLGTAKDNNRDCREKGRHPYNPGGGKATPIKLTDSKVIEIKNLLMAGTKLLDISRRYGVSSSMISNIARGKSWKQIIGKDQEKMIDAWMMNRKTYGENSNRAKLTTSDALEIVRDYKKGNMKELCSRYGVSKSTIFRLLRGETKYINPGVNDPK